MLHRTMGGCNDTELKLLTVIPTGCPSCARVVTIVTPVVKVPKTLRNSIASKDFTTPTLLLITRPPARESPAVLSVLGRVDFLEHHPESAREVHRVRHGKLGRALRQRFKGFIDIVEFVEC